MEIINKFNPSQYINLIENSNILSLQEYIAEEKSFIISTINNKDIIDLGSGYGRLFDLLTYCSRKSVFIELNPQMFNELQKRSLWSQETKVINGDITLLDKYEYNDISAPVFLLTQNTIGVVEGGWVKVIEAMKKTFIGQKREVIISFFKQSKLKSEGIKIYKELSPMLGMPYYEKIDFENGIYVTIEGYVAKWWSEEDIYTIIKLLGATEINSIEGEIYKIIHLNF